jgi:hypothetical protein
MFELTRNSTPAQNVGLKIWNLIFELVRNFDLRAVTKSDYNSKFGFWKYWISFSSCLKIQLQLKNRIFKIFKFDLRICFKFNSISKFKFFKFWISMFELTRKTTPAQNVGLKIWNLFFELVWNLSPAPAEKFDLRAVTKFDSNQYSGFKNIEFWFRAGLKFNTSLKIVFKKFWISILDLARNSTPVQSSSFFSL